MKPLTAAMVAVQQNRELLRGDPGVDGTSVIGPAGPPGGKGDRGLTWRGPWERGRRYAVDDAVESEGSAYIAVRSSKGDKPPSSSWDLLAAKGQDGGSFIQRVGGSTSGGGSGIASLQGDTGGGATDVTALTVRGASGASVSVTQPGPGEGLVEVDAGLPNPLGDIGDALLLTGTPIASPTFAQIIALHPEVFPTGWTALHDYAADLGTFDGAQYLQPAAITNVFVAEVQTGNLTGASEPDWSSAPDPGDTIVDGDVTWVNAGPSASFPPAPVTWSALAAKTLPAFVWPTVPNDHLYLMFPPGPMTTGASEPVEWSTSGSYVSDGDGYWWDAGAAASDLAPEYGPIQTLHNGLTVETDRDLDALLVRLPGDADYTVAIQTNQVGGGPVGRMIAPRGFTIDTDDYLNLASGGTNSNVGISIVMHGSIGSGLVAVILRKPTEAPTDGELAAGDLGIWLDDTNGATKVRFKAKSANGTVVTGNVALS